MPAAAGAGRTRPAATGAPTGPRARLCPGPARSTGPARSSAAAPPRAGPRSPPAAGARGRRRPAAGPGAGAGIGAAAPSPLCGMREAPCLHHCQSKLFFSLRLHCPRCAPGALPPPPLAQWGPGYRQPAPGTGIALEPETAGRGLREGRRHRRGRGEPGAASGRGRGEPPGGVLCTRSGGGGGSRPRRLPSRGSGWNRALGCPEGNWGGLGRARCGGTWVLSARGGAAPEQRPGPPGGSEHEGCLAWLTMSPGICLLINSTVGLCSLPSRAHAANCSSVARRCSVCWLRCCLFVSSAPEDAASLTSP